MKLKGMQLSKSMTKFFNCTNLSRDLCKLIGEFLGSDVPLKRGNEYYVLESGGETLIKSRKFGHLYISSLGRNRHIHVYTIFRRTPCSYIGNYKHTIVVCHGRKGALKFVTTFSRFKHKQRRFFPNKKIDVQRYLKEYSQLSFQEVPQSTKIENSFGNFYLENQVLNIRDSVQVNV